MMTSSPRKILTVVGARPQFVKAAIVSRAFRETNRIREFLLHTGQHYDDRMSGVFFRELGLAPPDANLGIGAGSHGAQTGAMLAKIEAILQSERPDVVVVYGDTNSTLAGSLAAVKMHIPVAHVEAGLRSFDMAMPEEVNRVLTDAVSEWLLAPTEQAVQNLRREGCADAKLSLVGDVLYDAALFFAARAESESQILSKLGLLPRNYILATVHRASTADDPARLRSVFEGLSELASRMNVVVPLHPRTRAAVERDDLLGRAVRPLRLIEPVGYLDMLQLERLAALICTDSGGVQREAFCFRVPCVTLRDETEWTETVECGANLLAGADRDAIVAAATNWLSDRREIPNPGPYYGNGQASRRIAELIADARLPSWGSDPMKRDAATPP